MDLLKPVLCGTGKNICTTHHINCLDISENRILFAQYYWLVDEKPLSINIYYIKLKNVLYK